MADGVIVLVWLVSLALGIAAFVAQMQLFGIRRDVRAIREHLMGKAAVSQPVGAGVRTDVTSSPSGAEIFVDGSKIGETPFAFTLLRKPDGAERTITLKLKGFRDYEQRVSPSNSPIKIFAALERDGPS
ncbi:MAG: PEGA domain-containing protein [Acidobacteriia bacterium]|nr:PEGA domain-containing protein [Terriglobia bacterium]